MASLEINVRQTNADFQAIKNKIVEKGVEVADGTRTAEYAPKVDEVYEKGKQAQYDEFWEAAQPTTSPVPYNYASTVWNNGNFFPKKDIIATSGSNVFGLFYNIGVTNLSKRIVDCNIKLDLSKAGKVGSLFAYALVEVVPKLSFASAIDMASVFSQCTRLKTIESVEINENMTFVSSFERCSALENLTIEGTIGQSGFNVQWSTKLSHDSLMSIINALKDYSGTDTWKTITLGSKNLAKLTPEEILIMEQKQWNYG